ncbi:hypothetical protein DB30_01128 [Enhygromyxa salina]|uniref:Uncharacterized protein n=1 Tax=Enhygromyxa salina TaxID=215803 RepID=A0A0C2CN86_9BACT|nr:hypothetical protein [Enhygromyxa salina]KIG12691.1 hypothetical protein DB30_01128 [Enhygromyxa salina]
MDGAREVAWAVARTGCMRAQIAHEFKSLVGEVAGAWGRSFPRRLGYQIRTETCSEAMVRLYVRRGDFEGCVELCCDWDEESRNDRRGTVLIRAVASARSNRLAVAEASGERAVRRSRRIAAGISAAVGAGFCWLAAGVHMPVVGGLMLTALTVCLLVGGDNLGMRVGEGMAAHRRLSAERAVQDDLGVQADIRRWNSLNRQLRAHRRALARGSSGAPFRRAALGA